jgi:type II secretory pathway predicted ATPase ExeA
VVQLALTGQEVYLLVDDAEQLDESALEALLALAAGAPEGRPHVFLFGESSLIAELEQISGEERFHVIELQPYTEEETREYLANASKAPAGVSNFLPRIRSLIFTKAPTAGLATSIRSPAMP